MLGQLDRYFLRLHLSWLMGCTTVLMAVCYIFEFSELLRKNATDLHASTLVLCVYALMKLPSLLCILLPFIALFSNLLCFRALKNSHQLLVACGSGRSMMQILKPFVISTLFVSAVNIVGLNPLSTWCLHWLDQQSHHDSQWVARPTEQGLWVLQEGGDATTRMIRIGRMDASAEHLEDISIFEFSSNLQPLEIKRIEAPKGILRHTACVCEHAYDIKQKEQAILKEKLQLENFLDPASLVRLIQDTRELPLWALPKTIRNFENIGLDTHRFIVYLHVILSKNVLMLCFVFLSALFIMRTSQRTQGYTVFAIAAAVAFMMYLLSDIMQSMVLARRLGMWGLWLPATLCFLGIMLGMTYEHKR